MESDRYVKIRDRSKDVIISGGENISSIEVEDALYRHPAVLACAVVARPDPKWGETPVAYVELRPGARSRAEELKAHCREPARRLQGAARGALRAHPEDLDRQDPEVRAARAGQVGERDRIERRRSCPIPINPGSRCSATPRRVTLTLNRPQAFNALSEAMLEALQAELDRVARDDTARVVVLAGARQGVLRGPRPEGDAGDAVARLLRHLFAQCSRVTCSPSSICRCR